jgi:hypothetical protein
VVRSAMCRNGEVAEASRDRTGQAGAGTRQWCVKPDSGGGQIISSGDQMQRRRRVKFGVEARRSLNRAAAAGVGAGAGVSVGCWARALSSPRERAASPIVSTTSIGTRSHGRGRPWDGEAAAWWTAHDCDSGRGWMREVKRNTHGRCSDKMGIAGGFTAARARARARARANPQDSRLALSGPAYTTLSPGLLLKQSNNKCISSSSRRSCMCQPSCPRPMAGCRVQPYNHRRRCALRSGGITIGLCLCRLQCAAYACAC